MKVECYERSEKELFLTNWASINANKVVQICELVLVILRMFVPFIGKSLDKKLRIRWLMWAWYFSAQQSVQPTEPTCPECGSELEYWSCAKIKCGSHV